MTKVCPHCKSSFVGRSYSKYCSEKCQHDAHKKKVFILCAYCGTQFETKPYHVRKGRKYCSSKCSDRASAIAREKKVVLLCSACGKEYKIKQSKADKSKYCSRKCSDPALGKMRILPDIIQSCIICGKEFILSGTDKIRGRRYCSSKCFGISLCLSDEFKEYPASFNDDLKESIHDRDGHECFLCGKQEDFRSHDIHHIDYNRQHSYSENLVSLCPLCHGKTNHNRNYWYVRLSSLVNVLGYCNNL